MAKTRSQLRVLVKRYLRLDLTGADDDSELVSNDEINDMLDEARREIVNELGPVFPEYFGVRTTMVYSADAEYMAFPTDLTDCAIFEVQSTPSTAVSVDSQVRLAEASVREFQQGARGVPAHYGLLGNVIYLWPRPTGDQTLTIYYVPAITAFATDAASPDEIPREHHDIVAASAANRLKVLVEDPLAGLDNVFQTKLFNLRRWLDMRYRAQAFGG